MANITTTEVWAIDTASATNLIASGQRRLVRSVRWVGATTIGHAASLTDGAGVEVWASKAQIANFVDAMPLLRGGERSAGADAGQRPAVPRVLTR
jgi:hypothetical protein